MHTLVVNKHIVLQCNKMLLHQTSKIQNFHFFFFLKEIINKVTWKMSFTGTWNLEIDEEYPKKKKNQVLKDLWITIV